MSVASPVRRSPALRWRILPMAVVVALGLASLGAWLADPDGETSAGGPLGAASAAVALLQALALWWRWSHPRAVLVATVVLDLLLVALSRAEVSSGTLAVAIAVYTLWREVGGRSALPWIASAAALSGAVTIAALLSGSSVEPGWWAVLVAVRIVVTFGIPIPLAESLRARALLVEALRERALAAERDREARAAEAVRAERALIARELHDIAAHHLSGIVVSAQAARALIDTDPDAARGHLDAVRGEAQTALGNLRQTLGLLRDGDAELEPLPTLDRLEALVSAHVERGAAVTLRREGEPVPLGPLAELTVYRMVQESLTNAARHAPGAACQVELRYLREAVEVRVVNERPPHPVAPIISSGGLGLLGMRERAALVGAELTVGATAAGGWLTALRLPAAEDLR